MSEQIPTIAISAGDPSGIGPEIIAKALADESVRRLARWIVVGQEWMFDGASASTPWIADGVLDTAEELPSGSCVVVSKTGSLSPDDVIPGRLSSVCGQASLEFIRGATELCLAGVADAMVTAPVSKEAVALEGEHFTGHTEYIAELCGCRDSRMLLVNDKMRVIHVTTHCGLAEAACIGEDRVFRTLELGHEAMQQMGWDRPRMGVCGLNPHAGENGLFGNQESQVIAPAIARAQEKGIDAQGPFPADTLFLQAYRGKFDIVVAMYHDQGHVPMKLLDFEHTVNVSLGLPILRTSVDHGTAFDIAGKDIADPEDMKTAMRFAVKMAANRTFTR